METRRVYFDSSIWVSHILQEKRNNRAQTVQQLLDQIKEDEEVILVSHLVLLEVLEVIRKRVTEKEPYSELNDEKKKEIMAKIQEKTNVFLKSLSQLIKEHKVALIDSQEPVDKWFKRTYSIYISSSGDISARNYSPDRRGNPALRYQGVGHYDIQHALTAKEFSARALYTFDQGFSRLDNDRAFEGVRFLIYQ
ncbi:PIN domain-containing protein [Methanoculleus sp. 10]|uniref:type II toxin-antitoxin system VapC family toxin n=1 Tax=Methanoculleus sp. 10 TaxID=430615 RepID=UPI0025EAE904|nr:PIN domain-containing protein [Methanoculleus sp. 10]